MPSCCATLVDPQDFLASPLAGMCSYVQMNGLAVDKVSGFQIEQQICNFSNLGQSLQWTQLPKKFMRFDGIHRCVYNTGRNGIEANTLDRKFNRQGSCDGLQACLG